MVKAGRLFLGSNPKISKIQNRLFKVCSLLCAWATSAGLSRLLFLFLRWPLTIQMKQTRQAVPAFKQSILFICLWSNLIKDEIVLCCLAAAAAKALTMLGLIVSR